MDVGAPALGLSEASAVGVGSGPRTISYCRLPITAYCHRRLPSEPLPLIVATWNVNSVRQRLPHLLDYLKEQGPDALCLQETKCVDEAFPRAEIEDLGYNVAIHGQKGFNGVAILAKRPFEVQRGLPGDPERRAGALHRGGDPRRARRAAARLHLSAQRQSGAGREICLQARLHGPADPPRARPARL